MRAAPTCLACLLLCAAPSAQAARRASVRFVLEVENTGKAPLRDVVVRLLLPKGDARQEVELCELSAGLERRRDGYGNLLAEVGRAELAPGARLRAQWFATVAIRPFARDRALLEPPVLDDEDRAYYLADARVYGLGTPAVKDLAAELCDGLDDPLQKVHALHAGVCDKLHYVRDGRWDPAPTCLERGSGSCTEYAFCFIALARAAGLPARWAGGLTCRDPKAALYVDKVFHRWAEVWLPDRGWYPVDCSRGDGEGRDERSPPPRLGRVGQDLLILMQGDGGARSRTRHSYHSDRSWRGRRQAARAGYWTRAVTKDELAALRERPADAAAPEDAALRQAWRFLRGEGLEPKPVGTR
ncbi:MAG: transglutaminase domain-containing protein [Planctomycetota bacterium]